MIINDCKKAKLPIPSFRNDMSGFVIEFEYEPANTGKVKLSRLMSTEEKILH